MKYGKKDNEIADRLRTGSHRFIDKPEWKELRRKVVATYGRQCALNGDIHSCYGLVLQCECAIEGKHGAKQE